MRNHVGGVGGTSSEESEESEETDDMGDLVLDLLTGSLAPTTYNNYGTRMRRFIVLCEEDGITPPKLPRPACYIYIMARPSKNSPGRQPPTLLLSSQRSTICFETTLMRKWRWDHF
jgi:hypothetical protein